MLSQLTGIAAGRSANIMHLAVYRSEGLDNAIVVLSVNTTRTGDIEAELAENGFEVAKRHENA